MDELSTYSPESPVKRKNPRFGSRQSVSPVLRKRNSVTSLQSYAVSDSDLSEIIAPIPRKHMNLEGPSWLHTPSPEPVLRSPVSGRHTFPSRRSGHRYSSFAMEPSNSGILESTSAKEKEYEAGFARRWLRRMHRDGMKSWILPCIILSTTWIKWCVSLGSYSGQGTPPLFGDYEAQRHWMELTINLPFKQWYTYDLQYWGLDYPPLTAYVSWLCGIVGSWIDPSWFALDASRGIETPNSEVFMRSTVLFFDLIYVLAVIMFTRTCQATRSTRTQNLTLIILLAQPALLLIDHGHFQYNSVMLGLALLSLNYMSTGRDVIAAVFFVGSLGFKQMALYYAPAFGSYLLGKCLYLGVSQGRSLFFNLAIATSISFIILFMPFLPPFSSSRAILDPFTRIFPFSRGLFEDKVANFWCFSNVAIKWKTRASSSALVRLSAGLTALGFTPSVIGLLRSGFSLRISQDKNKEPIIGPGPLFPLLKFALLTSSMSFFLFSFQVHEKTILVPLLPLTLIMVESAHDSTVWELGMLGNNVGVFSMWPLLKRDGLAMQYIAMLILWNAGLGYSPFIRPKTSAQFFSLAVSTAATALHILELLIPPPPRYPDVYPVLNVLISTPVFIVIWLWSIKCGVQALWATGGISGASQDVSDWERERQRRISTVSSRGRGVDTVSNTSGVSGNVSLAIFERKDNVGADASVRKRHQSLGMANAKKRLGSLTIPRTPPRRASDAFLVE